MKKSASEGERIRRDIRRHQAKEIVEAAPLWSDPDAPIWPELTADQEADNPPLTYDGRVAVMRSACGARRKIMCKDFPEVVRVPLTKDATTIDYIELYELMDAHAYRVYVRQTPPTLAEARGSAIYRESVSYATTARKSGQVPEPNSYVMGWPKDESPPLAFGAFHLLCGAERLHRLSIKRSEFENDKVVFSCAPVTVPCEADHARAPSSCMQHHRVFEYRGLTEEAGIGLALHFYEKEWWM